MSAPTSSGVATPAPLKRKADDYQTSNKKPNKRSYTELDSKIEDALETIQALRQTQEELPAVVGGNDTLDVWSREMAKIKAGKDEICTRALRLKFPDVTGRAPVMGTSGSRTRGNQVD